MKRRLIGAAVGFGYAVLYGFWTLLITGGGHGNFLWAFLFFSAYIFGLFFPAMGFLVVDLRPLWARMIGLLICFLVSVLTTYHLIVGLTDVGDGARNDILESWNRSSLGFVVMSVIHVLPLLVFIVLLIRSSLLRTAGTTEQEVVQ